MGLFICAKCNCIENTALGHYWSRGRTEMFKYTKENEEFKGLPMCSECAPTEFSDDSGIAGSGKWHGRFPKVNYDDWKNTEEGKHYKRVGFYLQYEEAR